LCKVSAGNGNGYGVSGSYALLLDFQEFPLPLRSTPLKNVFFSYVPDMPYSCVLLSDRELRQQHTY